jgi:hypothetical protein
MLPLGMSIGLSRSGGGGVTLPYPIPGTVTVNGSRTDQNVQTPSWNQAGAPSYSGDTLNGGTARTQFRYRNDVTWSAAANLTSGGAGLGIFSQGQNDPLADTAFQFRQVIRKQGTDFAGEWTDGAGGPTDSTATYTALAAATNRGTVTDNGTTVVLINGTDADVTLDVTMGLPSPPPDQFFNGIWKAVNDTTTDEGTPATYTWGTYPPALGVPASEGDTISLVVTRERSITNEAGTQTILNGTPETVFTDTLPVSGGTLGPPVLMMML